MMLNMANEWRPRIKTDAINKIFFLVSVGGAIT